ncbi:hypothetical protein [Bradyrhizobium genomosp. III]|uniref:hypothetical protein n=1 Tax=Bradyrhizobium genomosp. III TaxID=2683271 RepID=UPI0012F49BC9|nr:hypothetical protein [Bradyrhizobium sp. CCBAU 15544]
MTERLCRACGEWHDLGQPWPRACFDHFKVKTSARSELPRPMVISDSLDGIQSMVSGERFDSKAELRRHYRANGMIEVGNDTIKPRDNDDIPTAPIEAEVARAFDKVS